MGIYCPHCGEPMNCELCIACGYGYKADQGDTMDCKVCTKCNRMMYLQGIYFCCLCGYSELFKGGGD